MMSCLRNSLFIIMLSLPAFAFKADEKLADPLQEQQAQKLFTEIRCVVCEGEALADSNADMAHDMRALIRKELSEGRTALEVKQQLVANYGEQILQTPPVAEKTYFLWFMPFLMLIIGACLLLLRKRQKTAR